MSRYPTHHSQYNHRAFSLPEMTVSIAIASIASILILTVGMTVIRGGLQTQRESEVNYQLQSSIDKIVSLLKVSPLPPEEIISAGGQKKIQIFIPSFDARISNTANSGTKMVQVDNFKKKGMRPNQKTINVKQILQPVTDTSQLIVTGVTTNLVINVGDIVRFDTRPVITRKVKSVNNPNAAVRTIIFDEPLPQKVWMGTKIRVGHYSVLEFSGDEIRFYENADSGNYQLLCRKLNQTQSRIQFNGAEVLISLETAISTLSGQKKFRVEAQVKYDEDPLFSSEFMPSGGGI